MVWLLWFGK